MPIATEIRSEVTTRKSHQVRLTGSDIRELLKRCGIGIPGDASVEFHVPGGGDWSNTSVEVDADSPVVVSWVETSSEIA